MPDTLATAINALPPLHAFDVRVVTYLAGSKVAHRVGTTIYVSPAMWDLMSHADPETNDLERLFRAIPLVVWNATDLLRTPLPMNPFPFTPAELPPCPTEETDHA